MPRERSKPRLVGDKVMIKMEPERKFSESGIEIVEKLSTMTTPQIGVVLAVGNGRIIDGQLYPLDIKPGERVLIPKWAGEMIDIDGIQFIIVRESDILAILQ
jgi:chaperonin GroES